MNMQKVESIHYELLDMWTCEKNILRRVPKSMRPDLAFVTESTIIQKAFIITKYGVVYELTFADKDNTNTDDEVYDGVIFKVIPELCNNDIKCIEFSFHTIVGYSDYTVIATSNLSADSMEKRITHTHTFKSKIVDLMKPTGPSATVKLENGDMYYIREGSSMLLDTEGDEIVEFGRGVVSTGLTQDGKLRVWSKYALPKSILADEIKENIKIVKIRSRYGVIHVLLEDGTMYQYDILYGLQVAMYRDHMESRERNSVGFHLFTNVLNNLPSDVKERVKSSYQELQTKPPPVDFPPPVEYHHFKKISDFVVTCGGLYILDEDDDIWEWEYKRESLNVLSNEEPVLSTKFKSFQEVKFSLSEQFPLRIES